MRAGELRQNIEGRSDLLWSLTDRLGDEDEIPQYALGAIVTDDQTEARDIPSLDLAATLADFEPRHPMHAIRVQRLVALLQAEVPRAGAPIAGRASAVDWRNRWGWNWVTTVRDQNPCQSCVDFGTTALVESMTRIEHAVWSTRSEGDLHDGAGRLCSNGWWPDGSCEWVRVNAIADPGCYPWDTVDNPYNPTPDRSGRTVRLDGWQEIGDVEQQKIWIDSVGPLTGCFEVFNDFFGYGSGVYQPSPTATSAGWHCVLFVGYDDAAGCWILKNSWGDTWGDNGYCRIAYGTSNIDMYGKFGMRGTNPDPLTKRRLHNGNIYESGNGAAHRNFEMLATAGGGQLRHWFREGSGALIWKDVATFPTDAAACPTFTATTYNRNMEGVYLTTGNRLRHCWNLPAGNGTWQMSPTFGPSNAAGIPAFIQSDYGAPGNFEVVVRTSGGRLSHWWRENGPPWTWREGGTFARNIAYSGPTLIQARNRNLHLVAVRNDGRMRFFWRSDAAGNFDWHAGAIFGSNVGSPPVMIEGQFGAGNERSQGNYELCVAAGGSVEHWWRDNWGGTGWHKSATFGHDVTAVAGLLEGSFGFNLEVIVLRTDNRLQHYWRDGAGWHEGVIIGSA
jgi:hypothetical protein